MVGNYRCVNFLSIFSGADLASLVREAASLLLRDQLLAMKAETSESKQSISERLSALSVGKVHFDEALAKIRPSVTEEVGHFCLLWISVSDLERVFRRINHTWSWRNVWEESDISLVSRTCAYSKCIFLVQFLVNVNFLACLMIFNINNKNLQILSGTLSFFDRVQQNSHSFSANIKIASFSLRSTVSYHQYPKAFQKLDVENFRLIFKSNQFLP